MILGYIDLENYMVYANCSTSMPKIIVLSSCKILTLNNNKYKKESPQS